MKILHVIPGFANASGPSHLVAAMVSSLASRGHEVVLAYTSGRGKDDTLETPAGVQTRVFPARFLKKWAWSPGLDRFLRREVKNFDVVHVHSLWCYTNLAVARVCRRHGVPYLVRPAGTLTPWALSASALRKRIYFQALEKSSLSHAAAVHVMSKSEEEGVRKILPGIRTVLIRSGLVETPPVTLPPVDELRARLGLPPSAFVLLSMGRFHPVKNLPFLVRVFQRVVRQHADAVLVLAGPQNEHTREVRDLCALLGLADRVHFPGEVRAKVKWGHLAAADVFAFPSLSENFGNAALEALWSGRPVVASRGTPWAELEEREAGFWLELDEQVWADALVRLAKDPAMRRRFGANAAAWAKFDFDNEVVSARLENLYAELAKARA